MLYSNTLPNLYYTPNLDFQILKHNPKKIVGTHPFEYCSNYPL
jgi:hypothetical protein